MPAPLPDLLILGLLVTAIVIGLLLDHKLNAVRQDRAELAQQMAQLSLDLQQAQALLGRVQALSDEAEAELATRIASARAISDELGIMTQSGDALAARLEQAARAQPAARPVAARPVAAHGGLAAQLAALERQLAS